MPAGHVGVVAVLEKCRATQLLAGDPFGNGNQTVLDLCLKAKPFECVLSLLGTEQQVKELEGESKARDLGEEHQLSISEGHSDAPFQSVIPQNFNSAEWAPLCRLSLSSPQRHLLQRRVCSSSPSPPSCPLGRESSAAGTQTLTDPATQGPRHTGAAECTPAAVRAGPRELRGQPRQRGISESTAQREGTGLCLQTVQSARDYTRGPFSNLVVVNLRW